MTGVCPVLCSGHGHYGGGLCHCEEGYKGPECEIPADECQVPGCSAHGRCIEGECHCERGYKGHDCSKRKYKTYTCTVNTFTSDITNHWNAPVPAPAPAPAHTERFTFVSNTVETCDTCPRIRVFCYSYIVSLCVCACAMCTDSDCDLSRGETFIDLFARSVSMHNSNTLQLFGFRNFRFIYLFFFSLSLPTSFIYFFLFFVLLSLMFGCMQLIAWIHLVRVMALVSMDNAIVSIYFSFLYRFVIFVGNTQSFCCITQWINF